MVGHTCNPSSLGGRGRRVASSKPAQAKVAERPCLKNERTRNVSQVAEYLPSIFKVIGPVLYKQ
jgi:hypothetical protein